MTVLAARNVSISAGGNRLLQDASLRLQPGRLHGLLGPNGAGKSTLLRILAGELEPAQGEVELNGCPLGRWTLKERARQRAVLPQQDALRFAFTATEVVTLGRLPCADRTPERESAIVLDALRSADASHLADRLYPTLSGGERARVQLARVMAQLWEPLQGSLVGNARYLLLDEPTANLDLAHQHACLRMARRFATGGVGILAVLHDPNLAMQYCDDVTLLKAGRVLATGAPLEALTAANLEKLYGLPVALHPVAADAPPLIWPRR